MALGDPYATLAELKTRLRITDTNDDATLTTALSSASRHVEEFSRRQFNDAGSVSARRYDPVGPELVLVDDFNTAVGLIVRTDEDDDGTYETTWAAVDFELLPRDGIQHGTPGWPFWRIAAPGDRWFPNTRRPAVEVTARWGWSAVPAPVREAALILAEEIWKLREAPFGVAGFGEFGSIRVRENPKVCALLVPFRRDAVRVF